MSKSTMRVLAIILVAAIAVGVSYGVTRPDASRTLRLNAERFAGVVTDTSGRTLADVPLRIVHGEELIAQTRTDETGRYMFENLAPGKFLLLVGGERALAIECAPSGKVTVVQLVVSQRENYSAAALDKTQWVWAGVGTAAVVGVATPVLAHNFEWFHDRHHVSP